MRSRQDQTSDDAFLQAILAAPDEDAPRLAYADYLATNGRPDRAESIRVQLDLARLPEGDERRPALEARERALLDRHKSAWLGLLAGLVEDWRFDGLYFFRRGFVERVPLSAADFFRHGDSLFRAYPVRHVRLWGLRGELRRLAESPLLARLTDLDLDLEYWGSDEPFPIADLQELLWSQHLVALRGLALSSGRLGREGVPVLLAFPRLARLHRLGLSGMGLDDNAVRLLTASPAVQGLTALHLDNNRLGLAGVRAVATCPHLAGLTELDLGFNYVGDGCGQALAASPYLRSLHTLLLSESRLGNAGLQALATSAVLAGMRTLVLDDNSFTLAGVRALAESPVVTGLTTLDLSHSRLGDVGAGLVAGSRNVAEVTQLSLHSCDIGDAGARALAETPYLAKVLHLDLRFNPLSRAGEEVVRARFGDRVYLQKRS